jgi:hypothetical protein
MPSPTRQPDRTSRFEEEIVLVDLPQDRLSGVLEASEIVLAARVIVRRDGIEALTRRVSACSSAGSAAMRGLTQM